MSIDVCKAMKLREKSPIYYCTHLLHPQNPQYADAVPIEQSAQLAT